MPSDPDLVALGARIRDARRAAGLTQTQLAEAVDTYQATISCIERGLAPRASHGLLRRTCERVGLPDPLAVKVAS